MVQAKSFFALIKIQEKKNSQEFVNFECFFSELFPTQSKMQNMIILEKLISTQLSFAEFILFLHFMKDSISIMIFRIAFFRPLFICINL